MGELRRDGPPPPVAPGPHGDPGAAADGHDDPESAVHAEDPAAAAARSSTDPQPRSGLGPQRPLGPTRPESGPVPGGPFAAPGSRLLATEPVEARPSPAAAERPPVASLGGLTVACILGIVALGGAWASRSLPDWEEGRWWMLTVGLDAAAVVAGLFAVLFGVSALGAIARHRTALRGTGRAALGLGVGCAVLVVAGVRFGQDWDELDVPTAWERVEIGGDGQSVADLADSARLATAASDGQLRTGGRVGGCYQGTAREAGAEVACAEPHTLFLLDQTILPEDIGDEVNDRRDAGGDQCLDLVAERLDGDTAGGTLIALVPDEVAWVAGDRGAVCVIEFDEPVRGSLPG